jgi:iron complex transport system permease protein
LAQAAKLPLTEAARADVRRLRVHGSSWLWMGGGLAFALAALLTGIAVGPAPIGVGAIVESAASHIPFLGFHSHLSASDSAIVWQLRLPRVVLGLLVGAMLSCAGATYQGVFRNPLVDPYLLGVAAGAGLGATLAFAYGGSAVNAYDAGAGLGATLMIAYAPGAAFNGDFLPLAAFAGGCGAVVIAYAIGRSSTRGTATLVLAGVTVTAFLTAIQTFVQQQHQSTLQAVYSWILGSLDTAGWHDVLLLLPYAGVSGALLLLHRRVLDVMTLGDEEASALGLNVGRIRLLLVAAATLGTAGAVAVSGLIGFLGIIVPHFVRLVAGSSYRIVLPLSLLVGGGFLAFTDILARTIISPAELPIGVVTAFFGAPFFAVVLRTGRSVGP